MEPVASFRASRVPKDDDERALSVDVNRRLATAKLAGGAPVVCMVYERRVPQYVVRAARGWVELGWRVGIVPIADGDQHVVWVKPPGDQEGPALLDERPAPLN
jgi:hypothetical protein